MSNLKHASRKTKRWAIILVIEIILICILIPVVLIYAKLNSKQDANASVNKEDILINDIDTSSLTGYDNIALFGVDTRDGDLTGDTRSDAILILSINHNTKNIKLLSVYRDTCVKVPDYGLTKCCHAYAYGGAELAMSTLNTNFDLNITEFATVDFGVLADIIDDVGGIDIEITDAEFALINALIDEQNKMTGSNSSHLESAGYQHLDGTQAVAYSRIRKSDSDFQRTERQRTVLGKLFEKIKSASFTSLVKIVDDVLPEMYTNLSNSKLLALAKEASSYNITDSTGFPFEVVTGTLASDGLSYDFADGFNDNVTELHQYLFDDQDYTPSTTVQEIGDEIYASRVK